MNQLAKHYSLRLNILLTKLRNKIQLITALGYGLIDRP